MVAVAAGAVLVLSGCSAGPTGPPNGDGGTAPGGVELQVPRLVINGTAHGLDQAESTCHFEGGDNIVVRTRSVDYVERGDVALSFWATPAESRSEVAIFPGSGSPMAQGHGTWEPDGTGVFDGGLEASIDGDLLTIQGVFESSVIDDYVTEVDFAINCVPKP